MENTLAKAAQLTPFPPLDMLVSLATRKHQPSVNQDNQLALGAHMVSTVSSERPSAQWVLLATMETQCSLAPCALLVLMQMQWVLLLVRSVPPDQSPKPKDLLAAHCAQLVLMPPSLEAPYVQNAQPTQSLLSQDPPSATNALLVNFLHLIKLLVMTAQLVTSRALVWDVPHVLLDTSLQTQRLQSAQLALLTSPPTLVLLRVLFQSKLVEAFYNFYIFI